MSAEFYDAPEVEEVAVGLIDRYHSHLVEAKMKYMFREGAWSKNDKTTWGQAVKVSARDKHLTGFDFLIIINFKIWRLLGHEERKALVDHELAHCGRYPDDDKDGSPRWYIVGHDLEDFVSIVSRHGYWTESVKRMASAMDVHRAANLLDYGLEDPGGKENSQDKLRVVGKN